MGYADDFKKDIVAPYVGAWIETLLLRNGRNKEMSHPTWVRGLKLYYMEVKSS